MLAAIQHMFRIGIHTKDFYPHDSQLSNTLHHNLVSITQQQIFQPSIHYGMPNGGEHTIISISNSLELLTTSITTRQSLYNLYLGIL